MNEILDCEKPQLVVLNGDLITGENTYLENSTDYLPRIVGPLLEKDLHWASTYGNHDSGYNLSRQKLIEVDSSYKNSYTQNLVGTSNPNSGVTNYYLPIFADGAIRDEPPAAILWFFDSRGGTVYQDPSGASVGIPGFVDPSVVDWFTATKHELATKYDNHEIPSIAFVHIPIHASEAFRMQGVSVTAEPGINDQGGMSTQWSEGGEDVAFMQALLDTRNLLAVFSGHDHGDDWCMKWDGELPTMGSMSGNGIFLCFGRHTGYGGYGRWTRGSRQVVLNLAAPGEVETWVRLESKRVTGRVTLNDTYGTDQYLPVAVTYTGISSGVGNETPKPNEPVKAY